MVAYTGSGFYGAGGAGGSSGGAGATRETFKGVFDNTGTVTRALSNAALKTVVSVTFIGTPPENSTIDAYISSGNLIVEATGQNLNNVPFAVEVDLTSKFNNF